MATILLFDEHTHQRRHEHHVIQQRRTTAPQSLTHTPAPAYRTAQKQWGSHGPARLCCSVKKVGGTVRMRVRPCVYGTLVTLNAGRGAWGGTARSVLVLYDLRARGQFLDCGLYDLSML